MSADELVALRARLAEAEREALFQRRRGDRLEVRLEGRQQRSFSNLAALSTNVGEIAPRFWDVVRENGRRRAAEGRHCWSLEEWRAFVAAAVDPTQRHLDSHGVYSNALVRTVRNVRTMLADGKSAEEIRRALYFMAQRADADLQARDARSRRLDAEIGAREKRARVAELLERERVRLEAQQLARADQQGRGAARRRVEVFTEESEEELQVR